MLESLQMAGKKKPPSAPSIFHGEVTGANFITAADLAAACTYTTGSVANANSPWLWFTYKDKELYVAKQPFRLGVGWMSLYSKGMVNGDDTVALYPSGWPSTVQNRRVTIAGKVYRVRLLKGTVANPFASGAITGIDPPHAYGSEWNDLFYPITNDTRITSYNGPKIANPYLSADFGFGAAGGSLNVCQEIGDAASNPGAMLRGNTANNGNVTATAELPATSSGTTQGWRPCLELVP